MEKYQPITLQFDGVDNARELGGIPAEDGRHVKKGMFYRTGFLRFASPSDISFFSDTVHLNQVFDLRTEGEVKRAPDCEIPGCKNVFLPTIDPEAEKETGEALKQAYKNLPEFIVSNPFEPDLKTAAKDMYPNFLLSPYTQLQYASFLENILYSEGPVLWHCSQGKDRTGLGAIFLLASLGVSREYYMADFAESNVYYQDLVDVVSATIEQKGAGEDELDMVQAFIGVSVKNMNEALDMIDREWGSLHNYINTCLMFSDEEMDKLRQKYLE